MNAPLPTTSPFLDQNIAARYEAWYQGAGRASEALEKQLLRKLLAGFDGSHTILEIGCGTGHFTRWLDDIGYAATGFDGAKPMLDLARANSRHIRYLEGDAHALPFADQSFDLATMITSLEFMEDPVQSLREAVRVAEHGLMLGVLNRSSFLAWQRYLFGGPILSEARLYTPHELGTLVREAGGDRVVSVEARTTIWPVPFIRDLTLPWGGFIGLSAQLRTDRPGGRGNV